MKHLFKPGILCLLLTLVLTFAFVDNTNAQVSYQGGKVTWAYSVVRSWWRQTVSNCDLVLWGTYSFTVYDKNHKVVFTLDQIPTPVQLYNGSKYLYFNGSLLPLSDAEFTEVLTYTPADYDDMLLTDDGMGLDFF